MKYVYSAVRFVPDPGRGECVNIGVIIAGERPGDWRIRIAESLKRAKALDDRDALPSVKGYVEELRTLVEGDPALETNSHDLEVEWLDRLHRESLNIVQFSAPTPVIAGSADAALDLVFDELVVDPGPRAEAAKGKQSVLKEARMAFNRLGIRRGSHLAEKQAVRSDQYEQVFDFAVANGRVLQLTQAWSFQRHNKAELLEDLKAWAWNVKDLRKMGGAAEAEAGNPIEVRGDVDIVALYLPPAPRQSRDAFNEARSVLEDIGVVSVPVSEAEFVGRQAQQLLVAQGAHLPLFDVA